MPAASPSANTPAPDVGVRRRPKDRKAQILRAAAESFSAQGYHAVSMEMIATKVGISAAALYRHYASKYDLFSGAVLSLSRQLVDGSEVSASEDGPQARLERIVAALIDASLTNRSAGGLYRWQARYLSAEDRSTMIGQLRLLNRRIQQPLVQLRPSLQLPNQWILSACVLSVIGSIVDHGERLPVGEIRSLMADTAAAILATDLPEGDEVVAPPAAGRMFSEDAGVYEALLKAAMSLFMKHGYSETSMVQIALAIGIPVSGIYRYFSGKSEILATGLRRAADRASAESSPRRCGADDPRQALTMLVGGYVAMSFANPELAVLYFTERVNLAPSDQMLLRNMGQSMIDSWARLLTEARPSVNAAQARFLVRAAIALSVDVGRMIDRGEENACAQAVVRKLMQVTLFGDPAS